jgi:hypothetical protein
VNRPTPLIEPGPRSTRGSIATSATRTSRTLIASALADAIICAREEGALEEDTAWSILSFADFEYEDDLLDTVLETQSFEELVDLLVVALESIDPELLVQIVGPVEELGGFNSSDYAVMTAGYATTWAIRRNGMVALFEEGDDSMSSYEIRDSRPEANDPTLRALRLEVARAYGGLGPGVWIAGADELDDELRVWRAERAGYRARVLARPRSALWGRAN